MLGNLFSLWKQSINPYLPQKPPTELSLLLQYAVTKIACLVLSASVQLDVIQFLPSAGSEVKLLELKSNIYYIYNV